MASLFPLGYLVSTDLTLGHLHRSPVTSSIALSFRYYPRLRPNKGGVSAPTNKASRSNLKDGCVCRYSRLQNTLPIFVPTDLGT